MINIKELEKYKGQKITIFHQAFGSGTFLGTLQNAYRNDKGEYIIDIIPYRCRKAKRINLMKTNFVIYEDYREIHFARGGMGLPNYEYFKKICTLKYPMIFKHCDIEGEVYKGYSITKESYSNTYGLIIGGGGYHFNSIEEAKEYIDKFEIEEEKRIAEWRERNKKNK